SDTVSGTAAATAAVPPRRGAPGSGGTGELASAARNWCHGGVEANGERPSVDALLEAVDAVWDDIDRLRAIVRAALDAGFGPEVLPAAERVRDLDPDLDRGIVLYTSALRACGRHDRAERELVRHIEARGGHPDTWFALVGLAERRGSAEDAATALDNALRLDPDHADALVWGWRRHARDQGPQ